MALAGKTTVFSLIERFYEPDSGTIRVDGTDIRRWPLAGLRAVIGMADRIIVLDAGRVAAAGTHAELVTASPLYRELAATQFLVASGAR